MGFAICFARENLCFRKHPALSSSVHMLRFSKNLLKNLHWGQPRPESQKSEVIYEKTRKQLKYNDLVAEPCHKWFAFCKMSVKKLKNTNMIFVENCSFCKP